MFDELERFVINDVVTLSLLLKTFGLNVPIKRTYLFYKKMGNNLVKTNQLVF